MLRDVYGNNFLKNVQARNVYEQIEALEVMGDIDTDIFREFARNHPALLFPAFQIQEHLQRKVLGSDFWEYYSNKRLELSKGVYVSISEFMEIHLRKNIELKHKKSGLGFTKAGAAIIATTGIHAKRLQKHGKKTEPIETLEEVKYDRSKIAREVLEKEEREREKDREIGGKIETETENDKVHAKAKVKKKGQNQNKVRTRR